MRLPEWEALSRARKVSRAAAFAGVTATMYGALRAQQRLQPERAEQLLAAYRDRWIDALLALFGVEVQLAAPGVPPKGERARLVVSNHRAGYDIGILLRLFGGVMVSRGDLASWPILGPVARTGGTIFVDREEGQQGQRAGAVRALRRALQARSTVNIFPEGSTFSGDEVRPFHAGSFLGAKGLEVEVVSVGLAYPPGCEFREEQDFPSHLADSAARARTPVSLVVSAPERLALPARDAAEHYRERVQELVREARRRLVP